MKKNVIKNKDLRRFRTSVILAVAFAVLSIGCRIGAGYLTEGTYRAYVGISGSTATDQKIQTYREAITLAPDRPEAYSLLLDTYGEDGSFGKQESEQFLEAYNTNHTKMKQNSLEYGELQSQIGLLYINGLEDASSVSRLRMALPFLKTANAILPADHPQKGTVNCYCQIGTFYEDYIWTASSMREITAPVMEQLIADIEHTLEELAKEENAGELFNTLGFKIAACDLLYDQRDILSTTIPKERVTGILDQIYEDLPDGNTLQKEQTKRLLETLRNNRKNYYEMINRAYSRREETP